MTILSKVAFALSGAGLASSVAYAQAPNRWDGTWSGTTNKGSPVQIVIEGEKVTSVTVRGTPWKVSLSTPSGRGMAVIVDPGNGPANVRLIRQEGEAASYRYGDLTGAVESGMLTRQ